MRLNDTAQDLEEITEASAEKDQKVDEVLRIYAGLPEEHWAAHKELRNNPGLILNPLQIDQALAELERKAGQNKPEKASALINYLVQESYGAGYNSFMLHVKEDAPELLCQYLTGKDDAPLQVNLFGNAGAWFCNEARYCNVNIEMNGGVYLGRRAMNCSFDIKGKSGRFCGQASENSQFIIRGDAEVGCGNGARRSSFIIGGNAGNSCGILSFSSKFMIKGNAGEYCGHFAEKSQFSISGNAGEQCGHEATSSEFAIAGKCGKGIGIGSKNCIFKRPNGGIIHKTRKRR